MSRARVKPSRVTPWTEKERNVVRAEYEEGGAIAVQALLPYRSVQSIRSMAKTLGVQNKHTGGRVKRTRDEIDEEFNIIVSEVELLIRSICGTNQVRLARALRCLNMTIEMKTKEWFYERKNWRLGRWGEMFVSSYEWIPHIPERDEFLSSEGTFVESINRLEYRVHR